MAILIEGRTECSLCGRILASGDEVIATPHFMRDESHPLWRFSDSAMHRSCFVAWEHADAFRALYNELWPRLMPQHPREMLADGSVVSRSYIPATSEFGLVIRRRALEDKKLELSILLDALDGVALLGQDDRLLSFGPIFGPDAMATLHGRLLALRLEYVDDFMELELMLPAWLRLGVAHA